MSCGIIYISAYQLPFEVEAFFNVGPLMSASIHEKHSSPESSCSGQKVSFVMKFLDTLSIYSQGSHFFQFPYVYPNANLYFCM